MFYFQYTFFNQFKFSVRYLLIISFIGLTTSLSAYLGGISIAKCKRSLLTFCPTISQPGIVTRSFRKSFRTYALRPGFRIRQQSFGAKQFGIPFDIHGALILVSPCVRYTLSPLLSFTHGLARETVPHGSIR